MFKYDINNNKSYKSILKKKNMIIFLFTIILYIFFSTGLTFVPVEELGIVAGLGVDLYNTSSESVEYGVPVSIYNFTTTEVTTNIVQTGTGQTIGKARGDRQSKFNKKFLAGLERVVIFSEDFSKYSISPMIDMLFTNPNVNDTALGAVCKGKSEDMLDLNIPGYNTSSDYIENLIARGTDLNFFSDNYKVMDMYVRIDVEGRNLVLPYIEIKEKMPDITGLAIFDKDKMVRKISMEDVPALNILRENNVRGVVSLQKNSKEYIDLYATSKRKIKVEKTNDKFNFIVDLSLTGEIVSNSMYINIYSDSKIKEQFEKDMEQHLEEIYTLFIEKMQSEYKIDVIELGRVAAANFGRGTGTNWNEVICNSDITRIKVNVDVNVDHMGRGDY